MTRLLELAFISIVNTDAFNFKSGRNILSLYGLKRIRSSLHFIGCIGLYIDILHDSSPVNLTKNPIVRFRNNFKKKKKRTIRLMDLNSEEKGQTGTRSNEAEKRCDQGCEERGK